MPHGFQVRPQFVCFCLRYDKNLTLAWHTLATIAYTLKPSHSTGADLRGGCRGCIRRPPPSPPIDDLRLPNSTGILPKKNYVVYWCWRKTWDEVEWGIYVKRHKHGSLVRHITSHLRHSLVVNSLQRTMLDPPRICPCCTLNSSKYIYIFCSIQWFLKTARFTNQPWNGP